eukprot:scaffold4697_cov277-Prasinococcus_capsulatus_cf.AAC.4
MLMIDKYQVSQTNRSRGVACAKRARKFLGQGTARLIGYGVSIRASRYVHTVPKASVGEPFPAGRKGRVSRRAARQGAAPRLGPPRRAAPRRKGRKRLRQSRSPP